MEKIIFKKKIFNVLIDLLFPKSNYKNFQRSNKYLNEFSIRFIKTFVNIAYYTKKNLKQIIQIVI